MLAKCLIHKERKEVSNLNISHSFFKTELGVLLLALEYYEKHPFCEGKSISQSKISA